MKPWIVGYVDDDRRLIVYYASWDELITRRKYEKLQDEYWDARLRVYEMPMEMELYPFN